MRNQAMPALSPSSRDRTRPFSHSACALPRSPWRNARRAAPTMTFGRKGDLSWLRVRTPSSRARPSFQCPCKCQNHSSALASRTSVSVSCFALLHSCAALRLSCSTSRRESHRPSSGPCRPASARSASCRYQSRWLRRAVSDSPASCSRS